MITLFKRLTLLSYFGLVVTLLAWILLAPHSDNFPTAAMLLLGIVPLLFPLRGLLYGKSYTFAWSGFLVLFYMAHAIGELYSGDAFWVYPFLELVFSLIFMIASNAYVRLNGKMRKKSHS